MPPEPLHRADRFRVVIREPSRNRIVSCSSVTGLGLHDDDPPPRVRLTRAIGKDRTLFTWRHSQAAGRDRPRNVVIELLDADNEPTMRWELVAARPRSWEGPSLDAMTPGLALEHLELDFEDVTWDTRLNR